LKVLKQYRDFAGSRAASSGIRVEWVDDDEYAKYLREQKRERNG
jgi:hypothetical protein